MSIPTESIDVDMTADNDQEHLWQTLTNLDPSEQLRLLRARIALLERQQMMNSTSSSCASFDLLAQNANDAADNLCGQDDDIEPNNDNEVMADQPQQEADQMEHLQEKIKQIELELNDMKQQNADQKEHRAKIDETIRATTVAAELEYQKLVKKHENLQTKMKKYQKELQQTIDELAEAEEGNAMVVDELAEQKESNANKFAEMGQQLNALQEIVVKMEQYQKELQQNIGDLQKAVAPKEAEEQNRWDLTKSHRGLTFSGLVVQITGKDNWGPCSAFAALPILKKDSGIFYYEVNILERASNVWIGLAPQQMPKDEFVGHYEGTYAYDCWGQIWGHEVEGCGHASNGRPYIKGPLFYVGCVVGCGVNLATRQIIYTRNGQRLETTGLFVDSAAELSDLFPCVTLHNPGTKIEANFGPNFEWKF